MADRFLTRAQAAARLGIAPKTLANLHSTGGDAPPVVYVGPGSPRYSERALLAWLAGRTVANSTEADALGLTRRGRRQRGG